MLCGKPILEDTSSWQRHRPAIQDIDFDHFLLLLLIWLNRCPKSLLRLQRYRLLGIFRSLSDRRCINDELLASLAIAMLTTLLMHFGCCSVVGACFERSSTAHTQAASSKTSQQALANLIFEFGLPKNSGDWGSKGGEEKREVWMRRLQPENCACLLSAQHVLRLLYCTLYHVYQVLADCRLVRYCVHSWNH